MANRRKKMQKGPRDATDIHTTEDLEAAASAAFAAGLKVGKQSKCVPPTKNVDEEEDEEFDEDDESEDDEDA